MNTQSSIHQLSSIDSSIQEPAQLYVLDNAAPGNQVSVDDQLAEIAKTPEGVQAIIQKSCDLVDEALNKRGNIFRSPIDVKRALKARLGHLKHEVFGVLFLDQRHRELGFKIMFTGTINGAAVYPREIVKAALEMNAQALILTHNHPGLDTRPSDSDIALTRKLVEALGLIDVRVEDHIIVGAGLPCSFREDGYM